MSIFLLNKLHQKNKYTKITQWFHTCIEGKEYEGTPAETIMEMNDLFIDLLKQKRLNLGISERMFRRNMCTTLCTMKHYQNINIHKTQINGTYPAGWTKDMEAMWQEWLEVGCFKTWAAFWSRLPRREWEEELPGWRTRMEHILMSYVHRDISLLVNAEIIVEDDHGEYVDSNQYDYAEERWD